MRHQDVLTVGLPPSKIEAVRCVAESDRLSGGDQQHRLELTLLFALPRIFSSGSR